MKRKLRRISELDEKSETYTMFAHLVARLGKIFSECGMVTFLEAENEAKSLLFYPDNRFLRADTGQTVSDTDESHELIQL